MDPPDRLQAPEEEYKFDQSGAGLTIADQPAEIRRSSSAASYVRSENSSPVQAIVSLVDLTQGPSAAVDQRSNYTLDKGQAYRSADHVTARCDASRSIARACGAAPDLNFDEE
jgi:hypothetical protein